MLLFSNPRVDAALEIPPEFIDNSLVWEALERAQLSSFLQESREGIDTVVGENGIQLLGLDEATSALDAETERIIAKTLDSLTGDITLIVIDQRLATVRHCDQVIHLVGGSLGEGLLRKSERRCRRSTGRRSCWGFRSVKIRDISSGCCESTSIVQATEAPTPCGKLTCHHARLVELSAFWSCCGNS
jgi:hypothetical protein